MASPTVWLPTRWHSSLGFGLYNFIAFRMNRARSILLILLLALLTANQTAAWGQAFEVLFADNQGMSPNGNLVQAIDGSLFGTTESGGTGRVGTVFKVSPSGEITTLASFNRTNGSNPAGGLAAGSDGNFYGTTQSGGANNYGTIFKVTPAGELTNLFSFDYDGRWHAARLAVGNDGNFYGTTEYGGTSKLGTVFKVTLEGVLTTLASFDGTNGSSPRAGLIVGSDGNVYGTTAGGGTNNFGTVFRLTPEGVLTTLVSFNDTNGRYPGEGVVEGDEGDLYGTTGMGEATDRGTIFKVTPGGELTTLVSFNGTSWPRSQLVRGGDGSLYAVLGSALFRLTPDGVLTTLVAFNGTNGSAPRGGLLVGSDGNIYGTTGGGGSGGYGTIFRVTPEGALTTLANFNGATSENGRSAGLIKGTDGNLYGTSEYDRVSGYGAVFKLTPEGERIILTSFNGANGSRPSAGLLQGSDGNLYGTTASGGVNDKGTIFKVTTTGALTSLASFDGANGRTPLAELVQGRDGNFYGTTKYCGENDLGTVFRVTPSGVITLLHTFVRPYGNFTWITGSEPVAGVVELSDGSLFGVTSSGIYHSLRPTGPYTPPQIYGTIFKIAPTGKFDFENSRFFFDPESGANPHAGLTLGSDGNLYGTMVGGGDHDSGTVIKFVPGGKITKLASFDGVNGRAPYAGLVEGIDGNFYGTTSKGGEWGYGTVFKITPAGVLTTLHSFDGITAAFPTSTPTFGSDGKLYGTAAQLAIWRLSVPLPPAATITAPSAITQAGATLSGTVNANGNDTTVTFEYGLTAAYGNRIVATPGNVIGRSVTAVSAKVSGLARHTTYFYRLTASNSVGTTSTAGASFITGSSPPLPPAVTITAPSAITQAGATLSGTVNANGDDATVTFDYGLTPTYGNSVVATPGNVTGRSVMAVRAELSGLAPHTTYFYRLTASNSEGTTSTAGASFITGNSPPVATDDIVAPKPGFFEPLTPTVLTNDSDADGDPLTITAVGQGSFGSVSTNGTKITYTPGPGFLGRDSFSYTVSDGYYSVSAQVEVRADSVFSRVILSAGSEVSGAGQEGSGIPAGVLFKRFGVPSINSARKLAFIGSYGAPGSANELSVFSFEPQSMRSMLVARRGQVAPGTPGALFSAFKDPLLNETGDIVFLATLSGGDTGQKNKHGLWVSSFSGLNDPATELIARTGAQPPGAPAGAMWKRFTSVAFSSGGADIDGGGWSLAFTASMSTGAGGVRASNDIGLWIATAGGTVLALREGQTLEIDGTKKKLRSFAALKTLPNAPGQGSGVTDTGAVAVQAFFTDGSQAMLRVNPASPGENVTVEALALPGDVVTGSDEKAARFGIPTQSPAGRLTSWMGSLRSKANSAALFEHEQGESGSLKLLARRGDVVPGIEGARFIAFRNVAVNDSGGALFLGRVTGLGISKANDEALWWRQGNSGNTLSLQLLAREGAQPPGVPQGARWDSITSIAISDGPYGPLFTARLVAGSKGNLGPGGVTSDNDRGLWAVDSTGELRLIVREFQDLAVEGSDAPTTLKSFTVLDAVPGSPAQRRSYDGDGRIVLWAVFTNGTQAIMQVQLP